VTEKKRLKALAKLRPYVREVADRMKLRDWVVTIQEPPPDNEGSLASMCAVEGRARANIRFSDDFFELSPENMRQTVVHELVHCHFGSMHNGLCEVLDKGAHAFYLETFERGIDVTADLIAPSMPLPPC